MGIIGLSIIRSIRDKKEEIAQTSIQSKNDIDQLDTERKIFGDKEINSESEAPEASASFSVASESKSPPSNISIQNNNPKSLSVASKSMPPSLNSSIQNKEEKPSHDSIQNKSKGPESPSRNANDDSHINDIPIKGKSSSNTAAAAEETSPSNRHNLRGSGRASRYIKPPDFKVQTVKGALKSCNFWLILYMLTITFGILYIYIYIIYLALRLFFQTCYKELGLMHGYDDFFMTIAGGTFALFSGILTPFWGWVTKRLGFRLTLSIVVACQVITYLYLL